MMRKKATSTVLQVKVTLRDIRPPIWRRLLVESDTPLDRFHLILQTVMGWTNSHLHQFSRGETFYGKTGPEWDVEVKDEAAFTLGDLLRRPKQRIVYEYDFGDSWEHDVLLEEVRPKQPGVALPTCLAGARACPPEDCGSVPGYYNFVAAITNPSHPEHKEMLEWHGSEFDPERFSLRSVNQSLRGGRGRGWQPSKPAHAADPPAPALRKQDLRELGWKALVAELGVANATRFVMELHEGKQDYSRLRGELFADKTLDQSYSDMESASPAKPRQKRPPRGRRR